MNLPAHQLTMTVLMTPDTANFAGNVHGGTILKLLDQVAYACASRYAGRYVVTLSVDQVVFRQPVHVGELVSFLASVNHTARSCARSSSAGRRQRAESLSAEGGFAGGSPPVQQVCADTGRSGDLRVGVHRGVHFTRAVRRTPPGRPARSARCR
jgi:acyl-coenzyme A thioesterase PaaI-like protein